MRNLKKFLALVLALMMTLSLMVTVNAADSKFSDADNVHENFEEAVTVLSGMGVIKGYPDGSFGPERTITRAEATAIVYRLATGDTDDTMVHLFTDSAVKQFSDVGADHWAAGYIGYCVNNGLVVGYGDSRFGPSDNVTGVQVLAMILRAVGYGQNKEFEGAAWATNVYGIARSKGLLVNVDSTSYAGKLTANAPRQLISELLFQAAQIPTVTWTMLGGYNEYPSLLSSVGDEKNPSLGVENFGLTAHKGFILGNQDTGELYTKIGFSEDGTGTTEDPYVLTDDCKPSAYAYLSAQGTNRTVSFKTTTGLDMFGHKVKVWYNDNSGTNKQTYAVMDEAMSATVYAEDAVLSVSGGTSATARLGTAAKAAGFSVAPDSTKAALPGDTTALFNDQYVRFTASDAPAANGSTASPVHMYTLISNNSLKTVDVVVILSQEAGQLRQSNTTIPGKTLTLGTGNAGDADKSSFGYDSDDSPTNGVIPVDSLVANSHKTLGDLVIATEIKGTTDTYANLSASQGDWLYKFEKLEPSVTGAVSSYKVSEKTVVAYNDGNAVKYVSELTLAGKPTLKRSGITIGDSDAGHVVSGGLSVLHTGYDGDGNGVYTDFGDYAPTIAAGKSYDIYTDAAGRFIGASIASDRTFVYGTYADFTNAQLGEAELKYYLTGVDKDGKPVNNQQVISLNGTPMKENGYTSLVSIKDFGSNNGNQITYQPNRGFMMDKDGNLWDNDLDMLAVQDGVWEILASHVAQGFATVKDGGVGTEYLLTNDTQFIIVSGHGINQTVEICNGLGELLGKSSFATITKTSGGQYNESMNNVYFELRQDIYGNVDTNKNNTITKVIMSAGNLTRYGEQTLFYSAPYNKDTGVNLASEKDDDYIIQLDLYLNGVKGSYFIKDSEDADGNLKIKKLVEDESENNGVFLTLIPAFTKDGQQIYTAKEFTTSSKVGVNKVYTYTYTSSMKTATIGNLGVMRLDNAVVTDATYVAETYTQGNAYESIEHNEFKEVDDINRAVSLKDANGAPVYTVTVAVIFTDVNVSNVYVSNIVETTP